MCHLAEPQEYTTQLLMVIPVRLIFTRNSHGQTFSCSNVRYRLNHFQKELFNLLDLDEPRKTDAESTNAASIRSTSSDVLRRRTGQCIVLRYCAAGKNKMASPVRDISEVILLSSAHSKCLPPKAVAKFPLKKLTLPP